MLLPGGTAKAMILLTFGLLSGEVRPPRREVLNC
jgi:hypothetical protein